MLKAILLIPIVMLLNAPFPTETLLVVLLVEIKRQSGLLLRKISPLKYKLLLDESREPILTCKPLFGFKCCLLAVDSEILLSK